MKCVMYLLLLYLLGSLFSCSYSNQVCYEVHPLVTEENGKRVNSINSRLCEDKISLMYSSMTHFDHISVILSGKIEQCQRTQYNITKEHLKQEIIIGRSSCEIKVALISSTLHIANKHGVCIEQITVKDCHNMKHGGPKSGTISKRWLPKEHPYNADKFHSSLNGLFVGLLSCGVIVVMVTSSVGVLLSCCNKPKHHDVEEGAGLTDNIYQNQDRTSIPLLITGSHAPPGTPEEINRVSLPFTPPDYITSLQLGNGDIPPPTPPRNSVRASNIQINENYEPEANNECDNNNDVQSIDSTELDPHYCILEGEMNICKDKEIPVNEDRKGSSSGQETTKSPESGRQSGERAYFVLDITEDGPSPTAEANKAPVGNRIYHVLEPLNSESQLCSLCNKPLQEEQDSMYLVILPDQHKDVHDKSDTTDNTEDDPIYHVLEQPSVICQSCLCAQETDPIYHEVGGNTTDPDPVYEKIKNMIRQDTSVSLKSHIYSTVPSIDIPESDEPQTPSSSRKVLLQEIRVASSSSDYASVPNSPVQETTRQLGDDDKSDQRHYSNLSHLVSTLKSKLMYQLKHMRQQDVPANSRETVISPKQVDTNSKSIDMIPINDNDNEPPQAPHHTYINTGPTVDPAITLTQVQMKLDGMKSHMEKKRKPSHSMDNVSPRSLVRSKSHNNYTPLIIAQRQKTGSYHVLNVEDIWRHQLANRYAPVSIVMARSPSPVKARKGTSMKSRKSFIREKLATGCHNSSTSDYEVPLAILPKPSQEVILPPQEAIPPPHVLQTRKSLPRQDALPFIEQYYDSLIPEDDEGRLYTVSSEPCLGSLCNDYDYLEKLSRTPSPTKSPMRLPLDRKVSVPASNSDYYDHTWDEETEC